MTKPTADDDEGDRKSWLVHLSLRSQLFIAAAYSSSNEYLYQSLTEKKELVEDDEDHAMQSKGVVGLCHNH